MLEIKLIPLRKIKFLRIKFLNCSGWNNFDFSFARNGLVRIYCHTNNYGSAFIWTWIDLQVQQINKTDMNCKIILSIISRVS